MQPPMAPSNEARSVSAAPGGEELSRTLVARAGALLVDLAEQATKLAALLAEAGRTKNLAGGLCRRAELARLLGRKLAVTKGATLRETGGSDDDGRPGSGMSPRDVVVATLVNDAVLSLDGIAVDVEYAADFAGTVALKNQVARARLAVTTAGCAIEDALHALAKRI